ncbi:unnamed protein product [Ceutorhynchus assimilis]|uniref:Uncharacterized protein n=1 Tax=Ceutorhynchus assimilis TaxID=467358 RepID=A0A9N9QPG4_9CUCU|nr:unnamed protein product [Ceutorhynchus assimilis]
MTLPGTPSKSNLNSKTNFEEMHLPGRPRPSSSEVLEVSGQVRVSKVKIVDNKEIHLVPKLSVIDEGEEGDEETE